MSSYFCQQRIALQKFHKRILRTTYDFRCGHFLGPFLQLNSSRVRVTHAKLSGGIHHFRLRVRIENHVQFEAELERHRDILVPCYARIAGLSNEFQNCSRAQPNRSAREALFGNTRVSSHD